MKLTTNFFSSAKMNDNDKLKHLLAPLVDFAQSAPPTSNQPQPPNQPPTPQNNTKTEKKEPKKRKRSPERTKSKKAKKPSISVDNFI